MKKKLLALTVALFMAIGLAACGGGGGGKDDPNAGTYLGYQVDFLGWTPMEEIYGEGENSIVLEGGGKGDITLDGQAIGLKWTLEGEALTLEIEGETMTGTLADGVLIFDFMGLGDMCFVKEGVTPPELEGESMDETIDGMMDDALDDAFGEYEDDSLEEDYYEDDYYEDDFTEDTDDGSSGSGELAEYTFEDGGYTVWYPADSFEIDETYFAKLKNPVEDYSISFLGRYGEEEHEIFMNNLEEYYPTMDSFEYTELEFQGYPAWQVFYRDMGSLYMDLHINFGAPTGTNQDSSFDISVSGWNYADPDVVMGIINSLTIN